MIRGEKPIWLHSKVPNYWGDKIKPTSIPFPHNEENNEGEKMSYRLSRWFPTVYRVRNWFRSDESKITHQMDVAAKIVDGLRQLTGIIGAPVIAGGSPRDWFLDRPASDIDIFLQTQQTMGTIKSQLNKLGIKAKVKTGQSFTSNDDYPTEELKRGIIGVFEIPIKGIQVQFIFVNMNVDEYIDSFPLDITMIKWENNKFSPTAKFMKAINTGVITQWNDCKQKYIDKIKAKFPDFDFVSKVGRQRNFMESYIPE